MFHKISYELELKLHHDISAALAILDPPKQLQLQAIPKNNKARIFRLF